MFVLDGSESVDGDEWDLIRNFAKDVINAFDVGEDKTRFGVVQFGSQAVREIELNSYFDKSELQAAVGKISRRKGSTQTHLGLGNMTQISFTPKNGARDPEKYQRVGILLTDDGSDNGALTLAAARAAQDADITMIAVGIGSGVDVAELDAIASDPDCLYRILLKKFYEVESLKDVILKTLCIGKLHTILSYS